MPDLAVNISTHPDNCDPPCEKVPPCGLTAVVPESTFSSLWDVFLLQDHSFCSFIITRQPFQRKISYKHVF